MLRALLLLLACLSHGSALLARGSAQLSRRAVAGLAAAQLLPAVRQASAADPITNPLALAGALANANAPYAGTVRDGSSSIFVGKYTDPMHPGGTRTISLQPTAVGPFRLAKVVGGGGAGEPANYELPAMVSGKTITIDFSPKGGPKDFTGEWDGDGIRFPPTPGQLSRGEKEGNKWPKVD